MGKGFVLGEKIYLGRKIMHANDEHKSDLSHFHAGFVSSWRMATVPILSDAASMHFAHRPMLC